MQAMKCKQRNKGRGTRFGIKTHQQMGATPFN